MKILLADDDEDQLSLRGMLLRRSGFETIEATDLPSAIRLASAEKPECAVVDLRFPTDEIGFELVRELKKLDSSMHVFLLTGGDPTPMGEASRERSYRGSCRKGLVVRSSHSDVESGSDGKPCLIWRRL